jgi:hypothetical protein
MSLRGSDLTKEVDFCQLESFKIGPIVGGIEQCPNDQESSIVSISHTFIILGRIIDGI